MLFYTFTLYPSEAKRQTFYHTLTARLGYSDVEKETQDINCNFLLDLTNKPAIMKISKVFTQAPAAPPFSRTVGAFYSYSLFLLLKAIFSIDLSLTKQL